MKSRIGALIRVQWLMAWRGFRARVGGSGSPWGLLLLPLLAVAFIPMMLLMATAYTAIYFGANLSGQGHLLLAIAMTAGQLTCLMFGVFYVISAFYFSKDLRVLVPLPIRPSEIALTKFLGILAGEYLTIAPVVLPALIVYGIFADPAWTYLPFALLIYLLLPVVPMVAAALFSLVLMRVTNLRRNRDIWRVAGALAGVLLAVAFQFMGRAAGDGQPFSLGPEQALEMQQYLQSRQGLVEAATRYFPTSLWATEALRAGAPGQGVGGLLLFAAVALLALLLLVWSAEKLFFGGLEGGTESRPARRLEAGALLRRAEATHSPLVALVQREIRLLNRTPSFLMAALLPPLLMPLFIWLPLAQEPEMLQLAGRLSAVADSPLVPAAAMGTILFFTAMSSVGATAVSREGRHFWISRSLPVPPALQVRAKILHSLLISCLNVVLVLVILQLLRLLRPLTLVYTVVGGLLGSAGNSYAGIILDILRPHLGWTDPQQAMKGNLNVLFSMLLTLLTGGLAALVGVLLYWQSPPLLAPGLVLIFGLQTWVLDRAASRLANRRYPEYEA